VQWHNGIGFCGIYGLHGGRERRTHEKGGIDGIGDYSAQGWTVN